MANPDLRPGALVKPPKGSGLIARKDRRREIEQSEDAAKKLVRHRDKTCRWPKCENCRRYGPRLEVAHLKAKGMGGDHGIRTSVEQMILLDYLTHQGPDGLEHEAGKRIVPTTSAGANGPCEFYAKDANGDWYLVAREIAPFYYERD